MRKFDHNFTETNADKNVIDWSLLITKNLKLKLRVKKDKHLSAEGVCASFRIKQILQKAVRQKN